jgi:hypothetical protein
VQNRTGGHLEGSNEPLTFRTRQIRIRPNEPHQIQLPYRSLDHDGNRIMDHVVAVAAYGAACGHWPGETITFRQGARMIEDSRKDGLA